MNIILDKIYKNNTGGYSRDLKNCELILKYHGKNFDDIILSNPTAKYPTIVFTSSYFVVFASVTRDKTRSEISFLNYSIDLDSNFDLFADTMSPKMISAFHTLKQSIIKQEKLNQLDVYNISFFQNE